MMMLMIMMMMMMMIMVRMMMMMMMMMMTAILAQGCRFCSKFGGGVPPAGVEGGHCGRLLVVGCLPRVLLLACWLQLLYHGAGGSQWTAAQLVVLVFRVPEAYKSN